ncbi:hypothetical protein GA0070624_1304 [Micromonospora rhizosphaerae]|uniref:Uncharacterized protein n=1 Tax=Micromonospora rhizosphaerae TaxID=568872 RepID=A0A1C6RJZ4_9ACTN|nr:hypothetical protein [Micromonospora rhizosphaerae]SCL17488.1 hypothetical protein GA0070624_1304 [Micromonospora rhizosphaerae]
MPERQYPDRESRELESPVAGKPALESPLPGLDTMLRDAADDATRRAIVPPCDLVQGLARRRRTAKVATAGVFGVVLFLAIGVAAVTGAGPDRDEDRPRPAASATALDPSLREYWTEIPILTWTPDAGRTASAVSSTNEFLTAVFSALGPGDHDFSQLNDLRTVFPDAPVGGPAIAIDQSVTRAELEHAAANLRKLDGVQDARVVEVPGLWFTVSATGPAVSGNGMPPVIDLEGIRLNGSASGRHRDAQKRWVNWVRATYVGPAIDRATFDLLRARTAEAVHIDVSQVVVTAESSARNPKPTTS